MTPETFQSINPAKGEFLPQVFTFANAEELESVLQRAHLAKSDFAQSTGAERARLLRTIADEIEALGDVLIQMAM
ncbi:MAG: aldehyde dehydrogenase family protein, partial [Armatimonadetes bacterium]|nr:aldehyde dehydrogenase family protein [Armatimonadota bacterium]